MPPDSAAPNRPSEVEIQRIEEIARRLNLREFANNLQSRIPAEELLQFLSEVEKVCSHEHGRGRSGSGGEGSREPGGGPEDAAIRLSEHFYNLCYRNRVAKNHTHDAAIALCDELNRRLWEPGVKPLAAVQRGIFDVSRHQSKSGSEQLGGHDKIRPLTFLFRPQESGSQPRLPIVERDPNASEGGSA